MVANVGTLTVRRQIGISLIEVITAIAILAVGIWAIVTLFPRGQDIIRRSGLRQQATQLAHEAISDFLADPAKMPFAIVPFDPDDPQIANRPVLLEPSDLLTVRYTYNFVWGEILDDGLPPGDPNKRIGLVQVGNQWRAILRFAPARISRVYREVRYRLNATPSSEFEFSFDASTNQIRLYAPVNRPNGVRIFRVTYPSNANPLVPVIVRELYLVPTDQGQFDLRAPAIGQPEVVEEYPIDPASFVNGVLTFNNPMPGPSSGITPNQLGSLRVDYFVGDPTNPQSSDRWWIVETGTTFDPDPTLKAQGVSSVFQTTFGGFNNLPMVLSLMPPPQWGNPIDTSSGLLNIDAQSGLLAFNLPVGTRLRVAYRAGDDPSTPVDESWFLQVIKPPDDFQQFTQADPQALSAFPFEQLRWFTAQLIPDDPRTPLVVDPYFRLQFLPFGALLAGLNVQVRYQVRYFNPNSSQTRDETYSEVKGIDSNGVVTIPIPLPPQGWTVDLNNTKLEEVRGASLLVRVSGGSMWRQSPPKTRADYVELATIVPPPAKLTQP
jgi:hypothetical protein